MNINETLKELDNLFEENRVKEIEPFLNRAAKQAEEEGDYGSLLYIMNEMIGFFREICEYDKMVSVSEEAMKLMEALGWKGSILHGNTLVNIANGLRAAGNLDASLVFYKQTEGIYDHTLSEGDFQFSGLYNNMSLLFQELGDYQQAAVYLKKALAIVKEDKEHRWELAVTYTNLANTVLTLYKEQRDGEKLEQTSDNGEYDQQGILEEAREHARNAIALYDELNGRDSHYAAACLALGQMDELEGSFEAAARQYVIAMNAIKATLGKTDNYHRMMEYYEQVKKHLTNEETMKLDELLSSVQSVTEEKEQYSGEQSKGECQNKGRRDSKECKGLALCREYFEEFGVPMLKEQYSDYYGQMIVGMAGRGSDCFGFDDATSRDHDWGPGFLIWLSDDLYEKIGEQLTKSYDALPKEYKGYQRFDTKEGAGRVGVVSYRRFFEEFIGYEGYKEFLLQGELANDTMLSIPEYQFAAAANGELYHIGQKLSKNPVQEGGDLFLALRQYLKQGYQGVAVYQKLAQAVAEYSQNAQYNYARMMKRGDKVAASFALMDGMKAALRIGYLLNHRFAPHDKWLFEGAKSFSCVPELTSYVEHIVTEGGADSSIEQVEDLVESLADYLLLALTEQEYVGNRRLHDKEENSKVVSLADIYLEHYAYEIMLRSEYLFKNKAELVEEIVLLEWNAFDEVLNEGGRASCQDDWETFSIMRTSQYNTWTMPMLVQYAVEFRLNLYKGWNPIMEKYGRMEQNTVPEKWDKIKKEFPVITPEIQAIMEEIIKIQVKWMEEFAKAYPGMASNARRIHSYEDKPWDTSYETYLRGEMGTYSDKMLKLYGQFIVDLVKRGENLAFLIMTETVKLYGYESLEAAAGKLNNK